MPSMNRPTPGCTVETRVTPTPRIATKARPAPSLLTLRPGVKAATSRTELRPRRSIVSPDTALIAIGTSCSVSARLRAVTTISPESCGAAPAVASAAGCAVAAVSGSLAKAGAAKKIVVVPARRVAMRRMGWFLILDGLARLEPSG